MTAASTSEPFLFTPEAAGPATSPKVAGRRDAGATGSAESLVDQARQEISQIVREVAAAQRSEGGRDRYLRFLSDRILRAMAAHGVVIWQAASLSDAFAVDPNTDLHYVAEHRLGTVTDHQLGDTALAVHDCLLTEIAGQNEPTVVPPTPGASDSEIPANPTQHPAAIVPIQVDPSSALPTCLLEVFLEPGGSPASQRGSLRFLAQMGDLAGEFLRADLLRSLNRRLNFLDQCAHAVDQMQELTSTGEVEAAWVDAIATLIGSPRVALCRIDRGRTKIIAVNHVDRIDHHGESADSIRQAAQTKLSSKGPLAFATIKLFNEASELPTAAQENETGPADRRQLSGRRESDLETRPVRPHLVVSLSGDSRWRIVLLEREGDAERWIEPSPEVLAMLHRLMIGAQQAWRAAYRIEAIPGGKWWAKLTTQSVSMSSVAVPDGGDVVRTLQSQCETTVPVLRRRLALAMAVSITTALLLCLPVPSMVTTTGVIRPIELDTYHAQHDATIDVVHVTHGQSVQQGDTLVTLVSRDLNQQQATLLGRRAVLSERREQFNRKLMSSQRGQIDAAELAGSQEIDEEIITIDQQLKILSQSQSDLVLRARRDGTVDAWRIREQLASRPLRRGDPILSVIAEDTSWVVDATIEQNRINQIDGAIDREQLTATASPRWSPEQTQPALPNCFGPVVTNSIDGTPEVVLRMNLGGAPQLGDQPLAETPARVTLRCGRTSIGSFLFEDIRVRLSILIGSYLGKANQCFH